MLTCIRNAGAVGGRHTGRSARAAGRWHAGRSAGTAWQMTFWQRCRSRLAGGRLAEVQEQLGR
ncbi:unnamed protein product [Staurois parvus]|uniref:Uncharacterized protein n=1 Tax=Staurois parvus TaxID=386267 RepID=A0ABN9A9J9_9NEOB|nr:unnamed protein product [Staurois parvus]